MTNLDCILKTRHHFSDKGLYSQSYGFSSSHVQLWELDHKEDWELKNWCFQSVVLEKTHESLLNHEKTKHSQYYGNQTWIFIERTNAEAPIHWPHDVMSQLTGKGPILGKIEGKRRRGQQSMTWLDIITDSVDMNLRKLWEIVRDTISLGKPRML